MAGKTNMGNSQNYILYVDNTICFNKEAIQTILQGVLGEERNALRDSLLSIITQEHEFTKRHQTYIDKKAEQCKDDDCGWGPAFMLQSANAESQITAVDLVSVLLEEDEKVYDLLWKTAVGKQEQVRGGSSSAINNFAKQEGKRKEQILQIALDPAKEFRERSTAYKSLALYRFPSDDTIFELMCELTRDTSIIDLYKNKGELSPHSLWEYEQDIEYHRDTSIPNETRKENAVQKSQKYWREEIFNILEYCMQVRGTKKISKDFKNMQHWKLSSFVQDTSFFLRNNPSHHVSTLFTFLRGTTCLNKYDYSCAYEHLKHCVGNKESETSIDNLLHTLYFLRDNIEEQGGTV